MRIFMSSRLTNIAATAIGSPHVELEGENKRVRKKYKLQFKEGGK